MIFSIGVAVGFLSTVTLLLALLLLFAERRILNYGPCTLDINEGRKTLVVNGGSTLLSSLGENEIFIPSACGGRGTCAYCKVKVLEGGGVIGPVEESNLSSEDAKKGVRLSCQVKVRQDIKLVIPDELFLAKRFQGKLIRKRLLTYDIVELRIALIQPETIQFAAGQYIQLESQEYLGRDAVMRAYSISSVPSDDRHVEVIIRRMPEGICTTWVFDHLEEGRELNLSGPYGDFKLKESKAPAVFLAGGSGMAPIWSILRDMKEQGDDRESYYFFSGRNQDDLFFTEELFALEKELPNFRYIPCLTREDKGSSWQGERGRVPFILPKYIPDATKFEAYLCGSSNFIDSCAAALKQAGINENSIFYDKFE
ncbi:Na+-transporting NADH:ubiquinone oxidoreductase subunit F [Desulfonatronum thiosulfatophilum]|uniref:Na+-transporting NADH:ubiquinone oxidoreductase subunit F n=1 Tax=Desulfonatronum thiosulfatophilum TaxID=617002 RepID=A0A1G6CBS8_9BACT|nr:2Fe-2S iron-sulfur cluster binding domain-containing protein [Desulfonatronum thiosulfatophilum]SDB30348.1 Na+-transporting NADH:ubiquinone oxidoreductase subunit F [Desulfonatronum thiosulfatophilum]